MQSPKDRIGIVASAACGSQLGATCVLLSALQPVDVDQLRHVLMAIEKNENVRENRVQNIQDTLKLCSGLFYTSAGDCDGRSGSDLNGRRRRAARHIFIITAEPTLCSQRIGEDVQVHLINPGIVHRKWPNVSQEGWRLHLPATGTGQLGLKGGSTASYSLLQKVIESARLGMSFGQLTDVTIGICASANVQIESIIGDIAYDKLKPGETAHVLLKVRPGPAGLVHPNVPGIYNSSEVALAELDTLLGETVQELFCVDVRYRHTLLPGDTTLCTRTVSSIRRHDRNSLWSSISAQSAADEGYPSGHFHDWLGQFLASRHSPGQTLAILKTLYDTSPVHWYSPDLGRLVKELEHRQRAVGNFGSSPSLNLHDELATLKKKPSEHQVLNPSLSNDPRARIASPQPCFSTSSTALSAEYNSSTDEARRIWVEMRKTIKAVSSIRSPIPSCSSRTTEPATDSNRASSLLLLSTPRSPTARLSSSSSSASSSSTIHRQPASSSASFLPFGSPLLGGNGGTSGSGDAIEGEQNIWADIAEQALRNQRSLGADTLKSFALGGHQDLGRFAPWL